MEKFKSWMQSKKNVVRGAVMGAMLSVGTAVAAFAEEAGGATINTAAIKTSFTNGVNNMANTTIDILGAILPFGLSIVSVYFVVKKGIQWVKKL